VPPCDYPLDTPPPSRTNAKASGINALIVKRINAIAESVNSRVQKIKARACGYRNRERFRNAIEFHCRKLELYPYSFRTPVTHTET